MSVAVEIQPPFAEHLGMRITHASRDRITAEMPATEQLGNRNGVVHGGALMALADNVGGTAATLNLPEGASTSTLESKTNFFRPIRIGDVAYADCTPLHRGRRTMVWQTRISGSDGKLAVLVTQTQMVLSGETPAGSASALT